MTSHLVLIPQPCSGTVVQVDRGAKAMSVIGSMLAGGDSIDEVAVLGEGR